MDGLQVLQVLHRVRFNDNRTRLPPVVVFTCSKHEMDLVEAYRLGAQLRPQANGFLQTGRSGPANRPVLAAAA